MEKIEIIQKKEGFIRDLTKFILEKSSEVKRDFMIEKVIDDTSTPLNILDYLNKYKKVSLQNVFGSTFQSHYRTNDNIYAISHYIHHIEFEGGKFYGHLEPSGYGDVIDFNKGVLLPVYYKSDENSEYKIATFDIDFNIRDNVT
jgi:hypothetical protein